MSQIVNYETILSQLRAIIANEDNRIANLSNASAILNEHLDEINWVGFYLWNKKDQQLVLGPFQGRVACIRINPEEGVCGKAFSENETIIVPDVSEFPGHIVCDYRSQSEIVIPLVENGIVIGVLDLDAPEKNRFGKSEKKLLESFVDILMEE